MKLRFSIRDLLWLTLLAAVLTAWWIDHRRFATSHEEYKSNVFFTLENSSVVPAGTDFRSEDSVKKLREQMESRLSHPDDSVEGLTIGGP